MLRAFVTQSAADVDALVVTRNKLEQPKIKPTLIWLWNLKHASHLTQQHVDWIGSQNKIKFA
jgi:hypothetical protein